MCYENPASAEKAVAHNSEAMLFKASKYQPRNCLETCKFFLNGTCKRGVECTYSHDTGEAGDDEEEKKEIQKF